VASEELPKQRHTLAFTLVELLVTLTIAAVLAGMAYPAFSELMARVHATSRVNDLVGVIRFARHAAITDRSWITLCPAVEESCTNSTDWATGIMVFADRNRDGSRQPQEPVLGYLPQLDEGERLHWRSFRRRNFLTFRSEGYTNWQNGSFHYCPASGDARYGKVLIVNIQGRTAPSVDADGDGIDEQANGRPLTC
jgi:type IV fimbrial biogenesis protein FimT